MESFDGARKVLIQFRKAKPIVTSEHKSWYWTVLQREFHNREVEQYGEKVASSLGLKRESKAKNEYVTWMESHKIMSFTQSDNISEIFDEMYKQQFRGK